MGECERERRKTTSYHHVTVSEANNYPITTCVAGSALVLAGELAMRLVGVHGGARVGRGPRVRPRGADSGSKTRLEAEPGAPG